MYRGHFASHECALVIYTIIASIVCQQWLLHQHGNSCAKCVVTCRGQSVSILVHTKTPHIHMHACMRHDEAQLKSPFTS